MVVEGNFYLQIAIETLNLKNTSTSSLHTCVCSFLLHFHPMKSLALNEDKAFFFVCPENVSRSARLVDVELPAGAYPPSAVSYRMRSWWTRGGWAKLHVAFFGVAEEKRRDNLTSERSVQRPLGRVHVCTTLRDASRILGMMHVVACGSAWCARRQAKVYVHCTCCFRQGDFRPVSLPPSVLGRTSRRKSSILCGCDPAGLHKGVTVNFELQ